MERRAGVAARAIPAGGARRRRVRAGLARVLAAVVLLCLPAVLCDVRPARAGDPEMLTFGGGIFDFSDNDTEAMLSIEYLSDRRWIWVLQPMTGLMVTSAASVYGYAGLGVDLFFGRRIVVTPSLSAGLYFEGDGKDLGHVVEFRPAVRIGWRLDDRSRIGIDLSHISNAGLDDRNPGADMIMLTYSVPFGHPRK